MAVGLLVLGLLVHNHPSNLEAGVVIPNWSNPVGRRGMLIQELCCLSFATSFVAAAPAGASNSATVPTIESDKNLQDFEYSSDWTGTSLPLLSLSEAAASGRLEMARWPDTILRRPADPVEQDMFSTNDLRVVCNLLKETARREGAVGLAAQQCGINARIVFLDEIRRQRPWSPTASSIVMINPRIVWRSPEVEMRIWKEQCLVLPPTFRATVLRDAAVDIEYQTIDGNGWEQLHLTEEAARCAQHELDHDRGILITDHVGLEDLENDVMRSIERFGHSTRMERAYERVIDERMVKIQ